MKMSTSTQNTTAIQDTECEPQHTPSDNQQKAPKEYFRLTREREFALKIAGFLLVGACYMCGYLFRDAYFHLYHLDTGIFTKTTPEYFLYGGYAAYQAATALLTKKSAGPWQILFGIAIAALGTGAYLGIVTLLVELLSKASKKRGNHDSQPNRVVTRIKHKLQTNPAAKAAVGGAGTVIFLAYVVGFGCLLTVFLYLPPSIIATVAAERQHSIELADQANGCGDGDARPFCFAVQEANGNTIARGFLIATATDYVALSDDGRMRVISLQGRQLVQLDMPVHR